jgi:hypothetical protein
MEKKSDDGAKKKQRIGLRKCEGIPVFCARAAFEYRVE